MYSINELSKTCIVQTFMIHGPLADVIRVIDLDVRDYINEKQQDYWFIQNIQHTILIDPPESLRTGVYIVHLVMSRMYD